PLALVHVVKHQFLGGRVEAQAEEGERAAEAEDDAGAAAFPRRDAQPRGDRAGGQDARVVDQELRLPLRNGCARREGAALARGVALEGPRVLTGRANRLVNPWVRRGAGLG